GRFGCTMSFATPLPPLAPTMPVVSRRRQGLRRRPPRRGDQVVQRPLDPAVRFAAAPVRPPPRLPPRPVVAVAQGADLGRFPGPVVLRPDPPALPDGPVVVAAPVDGFPAHGGSWGGEGGDRHPQHRADELRRHPLDVVPPFKNGDVLVQVLFVHTTERP